jgi:hypothetical protein
MTRGTEDADDDHPEEKETAWRLVMAPVVWAMHFLASYGTASIWCAKVAGSAGSLGGARAAIAVYTVVALIGIGMIGRAGQRRHRHGLETEPHDFDTPGDRHRFLGFATLLLAGLSAVATLYVAMAAVFIADCR